MSIESPPAAPGPGLQRLWTPLAFGIALIGVVGSLYLSLGLELKACPLCFYQRAFIMAVKAGPCPGFVLARVVRGGAAPPATWPAAAGEGRVGVFPLFRAAGRFGASPGRISL